MAEPIEPASLSDHVRREDGPGKVPAPMPEVARREHDVKGTARVNDGSSAPVETEAAGESTPIDNGSTASSAIPASIPWPRLARQDDFPAREPSTAERDRPGGSSQWWIWIAAQICGFGLLLGGYFLGQAWSNAPRPEKAADATGAASKKSPRLGGERALAAANEALKAERKGDLQAARVIYENMLQQPLPMPAAEYRLALLSLHQGDYAETERHLNRSMLAGDEIADCALLQASLAGMRGDYNSASAHLALAARAQPFDAKFFFCWGESLRRAGKLSDAIQRLTQALDRPDNPAARELYLFKLRLARVEAGDGPFAAEVAAHLDGRASHGDWRLLSAAQEIGRRNFAAAARQLEQARAILPPEVFRVYAHDYLFQTQVARPELHELLTVSAPALGAAADAPLEDPAVWTAAEADPAGWPPFPTSD